MKTKWLAKWLAIGLPPLLVALAAVVVWHNSETPPPAAVDLLCPDLVAGCSLQLGAHHVSVGLAGERKTLQPFQVWVKAPGADKVLASFVMVDMNMGFNRYTLRPDGDGIFRAQITLPACVSGRRDWVMTLDINNDTRLAVPFATTL